MENERKTLVLYESGMSGEAREVICTVCKQRCAMNIEGLSEATLEKFISKGYIHRFYGYLPSGSDTKKKFKRWKDLEKNLMKN